MRILQRCIIGQVILFFCFAFCSCKGNQDESKVIPPLTSPLSGDFIGYGVIKVSFSHIVAEPKEGSESLGYLRRGALVRVIERRIVNDSGGSPAWVKIDTEKSGWLREEVMDIYNNESRAKTAAQSMSR